MVKETIFFYILIFVCLFGCGNNRASVEKKMLNFINAGTDSCDFEQFWRNEDTTVFINGNTITVKYEKNDSLEIDVVISKNGIQHKMGYAFPNNCVINYRAPIPLFEWTNGHIVCLSRSCGSYCRSYIFVDCDNWRVLERENILCKIENKGIIAYIQEGSSRTIVIEKVFHREKRYLLKYKIPCEDVFFCLDTVGFDNREFFISYRNFQDKIIYEKFKW